MFLYNFFFSFAAPVPVNENGLDTRLFDLAKSVHWIMDESQYTNEGMMKRRRILPGGGDDSDEENGTNNSSNPPVNDIYRLRQQKRFNK